MGVEVSVMPLATVANDRRGGRPPGWWRPYLRLGRVIGQLSAWDVVVTWGTQGAVIAAALGIKTGGPRKVVIISFSGWPRAGGPLGLMRELLYQSATERTGKLVFMTKRQIREALGRVDADGKRVAHLPVGVDTRFFTPMPAGATASVRPELQALGSQRFVVVAGDQLRDERNMIGVLDGLSIGLVRLTQNKFIEELWGKLRGTVRFPVLCKAHLTAQEVRYVYQRAVCLVNLVDSSWQPAGWTVMTEAMACGLPVIVNPGLTTEEMRTYVTGGPLPFLELQRLDPSQARARVIDLLADDDLSREIGMVARQFVERHLDIDRTSKIGYQLLREMVSEGSRDAYGEHPG
jgi:glycosyltransferase involved in cell wall biosynthesis